LELAIINGKSEEDFSLKANAAQSQKEDDLHITERGQGKEKENISRKSPTKAKFSFFKLAFS